MQIESAIGKTTARPPRNLRTGLTILITVIATVMILGAGGFVFTAAVSFNDIKTYFKDRGFRALDDRQSFVGALAGSVPLILKSGFTTLDIPNIQIDLKFKYVKKLRDKRAEAIERGNLVSSADDLVPATLTTGGKTVRVKLRLKGDMLDHLRGDKWSFRVEVRDGEEVLGMRRFSVQHPRARGFQGETLFDAALRKFDILAPRYEFVTLTVNGQNLGIMALEEHFSKELLENRGRKEGVIVNFDESLFWASLSCGSGDGCFDGYSPFDSFQNTSISGFRSSAIAKSPKLSSDYRVAVGLLRSFVTGELPASEVFDAERLGAFIAVAQVWASWHTVRWHNLRFYLNPYTMKLEPVGFDGNLQSPDVKKMFRQTSLIQMLRDKKVYAAYLKAAQQLATEVGNGDFMRELRQVEDKYLPLLLSEFYFLSRYNFDGVIERSRTSVKASDYPLLTHAFIIDGPDGNPYLELTNATEKVVQIESIEWVGENGTRPFVPVTELRLPLVLTGIGSPYDIPEIEPVPRPQTERIPFEKQKPDSTDRLRVAARIVGTDIRMVATADPYYPELLVSPVPQSSVQDALARHPFLRASGGDRVLSIEPGTWQVAGNLVLPKGYSLEIPAGTTLRFAANAVFVANGPVRFSGTAEAPIVLEGDSDVWQGVVVMEAGGPSEWSHVTVRNTTGINQGAWQLTGGTVFYKSNIRLVGSTFDGNRGEDAINIINSEFEMDRVTISNTASDGFDGDFVTGTVRNSTFLDVGELGGGDAVDVSGSSVTVEGSHFERVSDKALSVGERSTMRATNLTMNDVGAGAASKDGSQLDLTDTNITGAHVSGLMSYVKKPEYGGAEIIADSVTVADSINIAIAQLGSRITLNGEIVEAKPVDVDELYKTVMKPGAK